MNLVRSTSGGKRGVAAALAVAALLAALALSAATAPVAKAATCPSFRVLHNDRIGPAVLPAGNYTITAPSSGLSCPQASTLFTRFLQDWDGVLPAPWRVIAQGSGRASFKRGNAAGFSVVRGGSEEGEEEEETNPYVGRICPGSYTVNAGRTVGPLFFRKGQYLVYLPSRSLIGCNRATLLFTRFLSQPGGKLPFPWQLRNQTATFYKPQFPVRSAFRIESAVGSL